MRRASVLFIVLFGATGVWTSSACSSTPSSGAREQFVQQLQQPGPHRFDQVQVGDGKSALDAAQAACVATAFEKDKFPMEAALDGKVPTKVDVKQLNKDVKACLQDPGTTTIGPFG